MKEYDPEWGRAFWTGTVGAISDLQAARVRELVEGAGQPFEYQSFPQMTHSMHGADPALFARTVTQWASALPAEAG
jgi:hypothetical protein